VFVPTHSILDEILTHKVGEVAERQQRRALADVRRDAEAADSPRGFASALRLPTVALIAEVKKASPSKGILVEDFDPIALADIYQRGGAAALSVLTDERFFQGSLAYMTEARTHSGLPTLRKDFIIDPYQIYEARAAQADAILLIAAALDDAQLRDLFALANEIKLDVLVEVHNETELARTLAIGASLIGINNRDLGNFREDLGVTERLAALTPPYITLVAESGIRTVEDVQRMAQAGVHAILVGEGLVKAENIISQVRLFSLQARKSWQRAEG
jgi:indole-3-glycerol phosphate synthase